MKETDRKKLREALQLLEEIKIDPADLRIEAETSFDEAVVLGTQTAYLRAGFFFLRLAECDQKVDSDLKEIFDEKGAVWPVSAYVVPSEEEVEKLAGRFSD